MAAASPPRAAVVELFVADMARAMAFYRRLGLEFHLGTEADTHCEALLPGGLRLALDTQASLAGFYPGWSPPSGGGHRTALAFELDSAAEVDRWYRQLVADGAHGEVEPFDAPWGQRYAVLTDPDGNGVDLFASADQA